MAGRPLARPLTRKASEQAPERPVRGQPRERRRASPPCSRERSDRLGHDEDGGRRPEREGDGHDRREGGQDRAVALDAEARQKGRKRQRQQGARRR